jgi:hypothetical protein
MIEISSLGEIKFNWQLVDIRKTTSYAIIFIQGIPSLVIPENKVTSGEYEPFIELFKEYKRKSSPSEI